MSVEVSDDATTRRLLNTFRDLFSMAPILKSSTATMLYLYIYRYIEREYMKKMMHKERERKRERELSGFLQSQVVLQPIRLLIP